MYWSFQASVAKVFLQEISFKHKLYDTLQETLLPTNGMCTCVSMKGLRFVPFLDMPCKNLFTCVQIVFPKMGMPHKNLFTCVKIDFPKMK